jgi:hypothetical protein
MTIAYTSEDIEQASKELASAKLIANSREDWALIRWCERAVSVARLRSASETVRNLRGNR